MSTRTRILLVEDEPGLVLTITDRLASQGYAVEASSNGDEAYERALNEPFDLIVLDVMLPGRSGFDICRSLREKGVRTAILMLTARGQLDDKVQGLRLGADDYLTKPFEMLELLARVEALLRRTQPAPAVGVLRFGELEIDRARAEVRVRGEGVVLTVKEYQLLRYLAERSGEVVSREELLREVWGVRHASSRTIDVHVTWLRQKIEPVAAMPRYVQTVRGTGYRFVG